MMVSYNISHIRHFFVSKIKQIWRPLLVGQLLSILLAASGAANDTLHFDCNLSAPSLQAGLIYFFLSLVSVGFLIERRRMLRETESINNQVARNISFRENDGSLTTSGEHFQRQDSNSRHLNRVEDSDGEIADSPDANNESGSTTNSSRLEIVHFSQTNSCSISLKMYFIMAILDVEGNYFTYLAFRYTTLTSVSLLDALAIPSAMVFSRFLLRRSYRRSHFLGAIICILGVVVNVFVDFKDGKGGGENNLNQDDGYIHNKFPRQVEGDFYAILGAMIYGLNDVLTERSVKHIGGVREYQAMIGIFGTCVAFAQGLIFDRAAIQAFFNRDDDMCSTSKALFILLASGLFGVASYVGISNFLVESDAAFLNLSLLTGDFWAVGFSIVVQRILPSAMFWLALVLIVAGVFVYELSESPILADRDDEYEEEVSDFDHFLSSGLIEQRGEIITSHNRRELEMPNEII